MPKYDGISCVCWFNNNNLIFGTKSSDLLGEDITKICSRIINTEKLIEFFNNNKEIVGIRGELILHNSYIPNITRLADLNGLLRLKETNMSMLKYLHLVIYFVYSDPKIELNETLYKYLLELKNYEIETSLLYLKPSNLDLVTENVLKQLVKLMPIEYDSDGFVFRKNNLDFDQSIKVKFAYYF